MTISVLAVDDSRTMRDMINLALTSEGFEVVLAEDGQQGLEVLEAADPDVIITDIRMPNMNGYIVGKQSIVRSTSQPLQHVTAQHAPVTDCQAC